MSDSSYLRCRHCRGFYALALSECRYCGKDVPVKNADGSPRVFADRAICRAIQTAEFERLPPEAHEDPMRPDPELLDKLCYCLHCGPGAANFEAVEMRWMANEHMWACPCTTCGGRGFSFDVHLAEPLWQCAACEHWYSPPGDDRRRSMARCPKCGSGEANGWFDDEVDEGEFDEEEWEGMPEIPLAEVKGPEGEAEEEAEVPWEEEDSERSLLNPNGGEPAMRDDIDFPNDRPPPGPRPSTLDDGIPY